MDITRSFIETAVAKALRDIQRDPDRGVRNIVDLGLRFSSARGAQRSFLHTAQKMLQNRRSAYYGVARRAAGQYDHEAVKAFGVNLGYHGFVKGAKELRRQQAALGVYLPWCAVISISLRAGDGLTVQALQSLIEQGKQLGMYTYCIDLQMEDLPDIAPLLQSQRDCAFVLAPTTNALDGQGIAQLAQCKNTAVCLRADREGYDDAAGQLLAAGCLFAAGIVYDDENAWQYLDGEWLDRLMPSDSLFAMTIAAPDCSPRTQKRMLAFARDIRDRQEHPMFVLDAFGDKAYMDKTISGRSCLLRIDAQGNAYSRMHGTSPGGNVLFSPLVDVLRQIMPPMAST